jgi:aspartate/methionine/tyrosine aminotransferase
MIESIFSKISKIAKTKNAINLGQGFPDFDGPEFIKNYVTEAMAKGLNQYAPLEGLEILRENIAILFSKKYGLKLDIQKEITITSGAAEALFATITGLVKPGDKVLAVDPIFDIYVAAVNTAGGILETVKCEEPEFNVAQSVLKKALENKYKLIIINTPHNPSGYMWKSEEYNIFSDYLEKNNCYLLCDEVYEFITFDEPHVSPMQNKKLRDRVIKISSAGKTFGMTGWKIGWTVASEEITEKIRDVHQNIVYAVSTPMQYAVAKSLEQFDEYEAYLRTTYLKKRDFLFNGLEVLGLNPIKPSGGYFILCNINHLLQEGETDGQLCLRLIEDCSVATIPLSPFYAASHSSNSYLRFCLAKREETLAQALENLSSLKET